MKKCAMNIKICDVIYKVTIIVFLVNQLHAEIIKPQHYLNIISDVQHFYSASSICIVHNRHYADLFTATLSVRIIIKLSRLEILSHSLTFEELRKDADYYNKRISQSLYVVFLESGSNLNNFAKITTEYDMSSHPWFIIFEESTNESFGKFCENPVDNRLNLYFDTKMMVKCHNDTVLREWHSLDNTTDVHNVADWSIEHGFVRTNYLGLYRRRWNLRGKILRAAAVKDPLASVPELGTMSGYFGHVVQELEVLLNFSTELAPLEESYGSFNMTTGKWSGVVARLVSKEIDFGVAEFAMSEHRLGVIDFMTPLVLGRTYLYIKRPDSSNLPWTSYVQAFSKSIWILITIMLFVVPIVTSIITSKINNTPIVVQLPDCYLFIWKIFCQKPLSDFPTTTPLRIAYISMLLTCLVLSISYSAFLTSYLAVFSPNLPFTNVKGFLNDGSYKLAVIRDSYYHEFFTTSQSPDTVTKMSKFLINQKDLPATFLEAAELVCNKKVVLYTHEGVIAKLRTHIPCDIMHIGWGRLQSAGLTLTKNSPYRRIINYYIIDFHAHGIVKALKERSVRRHALPLPKYFSVTIWSIVPILGIFATGVCLATLILVFENVHKWYTRKKLKNQHHRVYSIKHFKEFDISNHCVFEYCN